MLIGAHMSIAGGVSKALIAGVELGCTTIQMFTKNNTQWKAAKLEESEIHKFRELQTNTKIYPVIAHSSYLINLASPIKSQFERSLNAFLEELRRAECLGLSYMVVHPGAHLESTLEDGIKRIAEALNILHSRTNGFGVRICLETAAGQGSSVGHKFEHLAAIIDLVDENERLGMCFDTCHVFAAGYDITTKQGYEKTMAQVEAILGVERIKVFHLNDSKKGLNCRVDRHEHVGKGSIGLNAFRFLLNDLRFQHVPKILETPKNPKTLAEDKFNLAILRSLVEDASHDNKWNKRTTSA